MFERIVNTSDGLIVMIAAEVEFNVDEAREVAFSVSELGAVMMIGSWSLSLTANTLDHLEQTEGTNLYFYQADPLSLESIYVGSYSLNRDEILKVKGAWEYYSRGSYGPSKGLS